jgi:hypothetical protein
MMGKTRLSAAMREVIGWLRDNPGAEMIVKRVGREILTAFVVWPGMPIAMSPDEDVPSYDVDHRVARRLIKSGMVISLSHGVAFFDRSILGRSMTRENYRANLDDAARGPTKEGT